MSEAKRLANRENAKKSTGPKTDEGKRRSAMNAVRHGFCAKTVCVHGEEAEHFNALATEFAREHRPASPTEFALVYRMAVSSWNLRRLTEAETAMIDAATSFKGYEKNQWVEKRLPIGDAMLKVMKDDKRFNALQLYQQRLERAFYRALSELRRVQKEQSERDDFDDPDETTSPSWFAPDPTDPQPLPDNPSTTTTPEQTNPPPTGVPKTDLAPVNKSDPLPEQAVTAALASPAPATASAPDRSADRSADRAGAPDGTRKQTNPPPPIPISTVIRSSVVWPTPPGPYDARDFRKLHPLIQSSILIARRRQRSAGI